MEIFNRMKSLRKYIRQILKESFVDDALDHLGKVGSFDRLSDLDKLILWGASGDEQKTKRLRLGQIYRELGGTFGKRKVKVRIKDIDKQPINHEFSKEMAGKVGYLSPYINYSDENDPYITVFFDEILDIGSAGDTYINSRPIMLDNMYPIDYNDDPEHLAKHDAERERVSREIGRMFDDDSIDEVRKIIKRAINEATNVAYTAVELDDESSSELLLRVVEELDRLEIPMPDNWQSPENYHMTVTLGEIPLGLKMRGDIGSTVDLVVDEIGVSDKVIAVGVSGYLSRNDKQHITILFKDKPVDSKDIKNWIKIKPFTLSGTVREFLKKK